MADTQAKDQGRDDDAVDQAPGEAPSARPDDSDEEAGTGGSVAKYLAGFGLSAVLTLASFWAAGTPLVWAPGVPILLAALAIGQMGVHLVFFLHMTSGPEGINNILALAFGVFVVGLVVFGSIVIMGNLDGNMLPMPMDQLQKLQR